MKHLFSIRLFFILFCASAFFSGCSQGDKSHGTMRGNDGKTYKTVKIGIQVWMAENLRETKYRNGDLISEVTDDDEWLELSTGARCVYDNDESNADIYGNLYNWYAVADARNIAPEGWRVPTDDDWKELEIHLGMGSSETDEEDFRGSPVGSRLAGNVALWESGELKNHSEFGSSGFFALPAGGRGYEGSFGRLGSTAYFWSATKDNADGAWLRHLNYDYSDVYRNYSDKRFGFSVRLVRE